LFSLVFSGAASSADSKNLIFDTICAICSGDEGLDGNPAVRACREQQGRGYSIMTAKPLQGKRVLAFVGDIYEDLELWYPRLRLIEAGAEFVMAGEKAHQTYAGKNGYPCQSDVAISEVRSGEFDGVLLPGGFMPDRLRRLDAVKVLIQEFARDRKCVAAICHGGWLAISADVYRGVRVTGSLGIKDDLVNAGAHWEDAPVVVDRHFVSSRKPDDLPWFAAAMIDVLMSYPS